MLDQNRTSHETHANGNLFCNSVADIPVFSTLYHGLLVMNQEVPGAQPSPLLDLFAREMRVTVGKRTKVMESTEYEASIDGKHDVKYRTDVWKIARDIQNMLDKENKEEDIEEQSREILRNK